MRSSLRLLTLCLSASVGLPFACGEPCKINLAICTDLTSEYADQGIPILRMVIATFAPHLRSLSLLSKYASNSTARPIVTFQETKNFKWDQPLSETVISEFIRGTANNPSRSFMYHCKFSLARQVKNQMESAAANIFIFISGFSTSTDRSDRRDLKAITDLDFKAYALSIGQLSLDWYGFKAEENWWSINNQTDQFSQSLNDAKGKILEKVIGEDVCFCTDLAEYANRAVRYTSRKVNDLAHRASGTNATLRCDKDSGTGFAYASNSISFRTSVQKTCHDREWIPLYFDRCEEVTKCQSPRASQCASRHTCRNLGGNQYCECDSGFENVKNDLATCKDIDECVVNQRICTGKRNSVCENTIGGFKCSCPPDFVDEPELCWKICTLPPLRRAIDDSNCRRDQKTELNCSLICSVGYHGTVTTRCATGGGTFEVDDNCSETFCIRPTINDGSFRDTPSDKKMIHGFTAEFRCDDGYVLPNRHQNSVHVRCDASEDPGTWTWADQQTIPTLECFEEQFCPTPEELDARHFSTSPQASQIRFQTVLTYRCDSSYYLPDSNFIQNSSCFWNADASALQWTSLSECHKEESSEQFSLSYNRAYHQAKPSKFKSILTNELTSIDNRNRLYEITLRELITVKVTGIEPKLALKHIQDNWMEGQRNARKYLRHPGCQERKWTKWSECDSGCKRTRMIAQPKSAHCPSEETEDCCETDSRTEIIPVWGWVVAASIFIIITVFGCWYRDYFCFKQVPPPPPPTPPPADPSTGSESSFADLSFT